MLRPFATVDLEVYFAYQRLRDGGQYLYGEPRSYAECMGRIAQYSEERFAVPGDWATFTVERIGVPGLVGEIGWTLAPAARGLGFATEAARAVLKLAFDQLAFIRAEARLDARNRASAAIYAVVRN